MSNYIIFYSRVFTILYFFYYVLLYINVCIENSLLNEVFIKNNTNYKYFKFKIIEEKFLKLINYIFFFL